MNNTILEEYLNSDASLAKHNSEEILDHFKQKYISVPYHNELLFIFDNDRNFANRYHKIALHQRSNGIVPYHVYQYIVLTYCYSGEIHMEIDGSPLTLHEGDLIIFDRHVPHKVYETGPKDLGINMILSDHYFSRRYINRVRGDKFYAKFMAELMDPTTDKHDHFFVISLENDALSKECVDNILCETIEKQTGSSDIIDSFLMILLTHLSRFSEYKTNMKLIAHRQQDLIDQVLEDIHTDYVNGNLNDTCARLGYDPSCISKLIKQFTGKTFKELVNEKRMQAALSLVQNPDVPIYEIADAVGISNLTTFYKRFQAYTGMTPKQYRDEQSNAA